MVHRTSGQLDFADSFLGNNQKLNQRLDRVNRLVDWEPFEERLNRIFSSPSGRPSYPVLLLFKCLLLQAWYNLSDYALEEILDDRLISQLSQSPRIKTQKNLRFLKIIP